MGEWEEGERNSVYSAVKDEDLFAPLAIGSARGRNSE